MRLNISKTMFQLSEGEGRWKLGKTASEAVDKIAQNLGISPTTANILVKRGLTSPEEAREFLNPTLEALHDPFLLPDMDLAVSRLARAIHNGQKILIYGDYDVDGVTATALLYLAISQLGGHATTYIPLRLEEGYGVNAEALREARQRGCQMGVTVDCGISACEEIKFVQEQGMDIIVIDHHLPGSSLPPAQAVVCPQRKDCEYPFKALASVGLAFKLGQALVQKMKVQTRYFERAFLDLVALGTVGDLAPLNGENRVMVKEGLHFLKETKKPGLLALMQRAGIGGTITARQVGYALAPRLNAAGRVGDARLALNLLLCRNVEEARLLAKNLEDANEQRQKEQETILRELAYLSESQPDFFSQRVIVVWGEGWHEGVVGIVAARLLEELQRPAVVFGCRGERARGSARSIPGFDIMTALDRCSNLLLECGGHSQAAGLTIAAENLPIFRERINLVAEEIFGEERLEPAIELDAELSLEEVTPSLLQEIEYLEPFGEGNPEPIFYIQDVLPHSARRVGRDESHLTFNVSDRNGKNVRRCIGFGMGEKWEELQEGEPIALCCRLRGDDAYESLYPQLQIIDFKSGHTALNPLQGEP